ncbi:TrmH family RNA methyltransferase [Deinobacterium chartae]|uniref:TrmH family RNA methyltransferase n=1 Tax=Deinobacterium chartae TaxID=521158 RepID=A0A841HXG4_9DEIO|nr:RNA methyltransferase [Deinobacterium chartae]MBB6096890.1 TrmH family RNA methyltransferase [Deinobacterium chartae]
MYARHLESPQNPEIKAVARLKERRARKAERRFLIEGARELSRALEAGAAVDRIYLCEALYSDEARELASRLETERVTTVSQAAFEKLSMREGPDGVLAVAPIPQADLSRLSLPPEALVLVLEGLEKPGNLGALLRTADGVGVDAVFVTGPGTDLYNPNTVRASMGSLFTQSVLQVEPEALLTFLQQQGFSLVAATPHADTVYWDANYAGRVAVALGAEHDGLSPQLRGAASQQVVIPMRGAADSLNVGTAGALLLYEALRQRGFPNKQVINPV